MAITDLTGTKWQFKAEPELVNNLRELELSFISNNTSFNYFDISQGTIYYINFPSSVVSAYQYSFGEGGWWDEAYKTIEITGGTDATNAELIAWLTENATQIIIIPVTFDLSILQLSLGAHTIQVKARADGYLTSEFSNSATYITVNDIILDKFDLPSEITDIQFIYDA